MRVIGSSKSPHVWQVVRVCMALAFVALLPAMVHAQTSITGTIRDASGAVLPGVTVEASSPALIEKTRSVVTDSEGRYNIIDLRPGSYTVNFTLTGFNALRRDGIELTSGFTAVVNADLQAARGLADRFVALRRRQQLERHLAALPRALHAQRAGARRQERATRGLCLHRHRVCPG